MPQVNANGARLYYRLEGDPSKPSLLLVHPVGSDLSLWDQVVPGLLEHFQVLRFDLRGHGGSEATPGEYTLALLAEDILHVASKLGLPRFAICGVSIGGMAAVQAASLAPERVTALVICSTASRLSPPPGGWDARAKASVEFGMEPLASAMIERMISGQFRSEGHPEIHTVRNVFAAMDPQGYASACAVLRDTDLEPLLASVKTPTLVVSGRLDVLVPPAAGSGIAEKLPHAKHVVLSCGHFPPLEVPSAFVELLSGYCSPSDSNETRTMA